MNKKSEQERTSLDRIVFFLISFVHIADGETMETVEITEVRNIVKILLGDTSIQADSKFEKAANWWKEEMVNVEWDVWDESFQAILNKCITSVEDTFGKSKNSEKRLFINQVIDLANVDGTIGDGEIAWIHRLCAGIDIEIPNILDADPERRWDPEMKKMFDKLETSIDEQNKLANVAVDIVDNLDSNVVEDVSKEITNEMLEDGYTGQGTYDFADGGKYVGEWEDGNMHGKGTYTYADGAKYVGEWEDDNMHGKGTFTYAKGDKYEGEYKDDKRHGQGIYTYPSGNKYEGEYKGGKMHGQGTATFANGDKYVGEYKDGKRHGEGTSTFADGTIDTGLFEDGEFVKAKEQKKEVILDKPTNNELTLKMLEDGYTGTGGFTFSDGGSYFGEWKDGMMHGTGNYSWVNGDIHMGEFKEGDINGQGELINLKSGKVTKGLWKNGVLVQSAKVQPPPVRFTKGPQDVRNRANESRAEVFGGEDIGEDIVEKESSNKITEDTPPWKKIIIRDVNDEITDEMVNELYTGDGTYTYASGSKYVGEWKDGRQNGQGTYTFTNGDEYVGEWEDDNMHGKGTYTYADGAKYEGEYKDDKRHGQGIYTYADGTIQKGLFENGALVKAEGEYEENIELTIVDLTEGYTGKGTMIWEDGKCEGSKYAGEWKDGKMHGQGTYTLADGDKYVGESKDDNFHGEGTYTYASGSKYVGEWKDGKANGQGTYTFTNGDEYVGECKDGNFNGKGTLTKTDGTIQKGLFENGALVKAKEQKEDMSKEDAARIAVQKLIKRAVKVGDDYYKEVTDEMQDDGYTGKGCYFYGDRAKYVGEYKDGKMHGQGTYTYGAGAWEGATYVGELRDGVFYGQGTLTLPNGDKHVGEFKDDKRNGQGTYTFANGTIQEGLFENDKYIGEDSREDIVEKKNSKKITEDTPIWEIIQHEFINLGKGASVLKKEFSNLILSKYPHIKKGTLSAQISIQVINKRSRTNYNQCGKERVCGDNKFDFLFEQEDKTLCKYDKSKHGTWEIYKRDDGKLDVRIVSK